MSQSQNVPASYCSDGILVHAGIPGKLGKLQAAYLPINLAEPSAAAEVGDTSHSVVD
jgi:hypothetical protein